MYMPVKVFGHFDLVSQSFLLIEIYDNLERVGASVRHHIVEGVRNMWNQLNELARAHTSSGGGKDEGEGEVMQGTYKIVV